MRWFYGTDRANVHGRPASALGENANGPRSHEKWLGKNSEKRTGKRRDQRPPAGEQMTEKLVIAVFEVGTDRVDLEPGVLQKLDHRRARIEDQMRAEVLRHAL